MGEAEQVVYIAKAHIPSRSANSVHVMKMCHAIASDPGVKVTLVVPRFGDADIATEEVFQRYGVKKNFDIATVPIFGLRRAFLQGIVFTWQALRVARRLEPGLIFTRDDFTACVSALRNMPTVFETHTTEFHRLSRLLFPRVVKSPALRGVVVISDALRRFVAERYPVAEAVIHVLPDAVDYHRFSHIRVVEKIGPNVRVGYAGHLYRGRGVELIVELARSMPQCRFDIWGGTDEDINYWRGVTKSMGNVIFHGFVPNGELPDRYAECDVLLMPYQKKVAVFGNVGDTAQWMSPMKMFEYMASGRPIISSDLPVLREVLEDDINALLVPPDDVSAWQSALRRLGDEQGLGSRLATTARDQVQKKYTWERRWMNIKNIWKGTGSLHE